MHRLGSTGGATLRGGAAASPPPKYVAKDRLVLYSCTPSPGQELLQAGTCTTAREGKIGFEQQPYQDFVDRKTTGKLGGWDLKKTKVRV